MRLRAGLHDGRLTALDLRVLVDAGAYPTGSESLLRAAAREALSLYSVPHFGFVGEAAFTHRPPTSPLRGQGVLATLFALESHLDLMADALREDPLDFRRRHLATHEHTRRVAEGLGVPAPAGHFDATEAMAAGAQEIGWSRRWKAAAGSGTRRRGVGMALVRDAVVGERGAASLQLREDGSFNLFVGASAMGNGAEGAFAAAAAEALGVPVERVVPAAGDTDSAPLDPGAAAPTLYLTGRAVQAAAARVRSQILEAGARHLGTDAQDVVAEAEQVRTRDGRTVAFAALAARAFGSGEPIAATAFHAADEAAPAGAAVFAEVEADVETGEVRVLQAGHRPRRRPPARPPARGGRGRGRCAPLHRRRALRAHGLHRGGSSGVPLAARLPDRHRGRRARRCERSSSPWTRPPRRSGQAAGRRGGDRPRPRDRKRRRACDRRPRQSTSPRSGARAPGRGPRSALSR